MDTIVDYIRGPNFKLYCSYGLSSWGERMWGFAFGLALATVGGDLRLPALAGFIDDAVIFLFASYVGKWIDRNHRFKAAAVCLAATNVSIAVSAGMLAAVIHWQDSMRNLTGLYYVLLVLIIAFGSAGRLATAGSRIAITKDWIIVMACGNAAVLAKLNAMLLRLSLTAMILAPMMAGEIMSGFGMSIACIFMTCWIILSLLLELLCLRSIYHAVPELATKVDDVKLTNSFTKENVREELSVMMPTENPGKPNPVEKAASRWDKIFDEIIHNIKAWKIYYHHKIFTAGLALALLYMTVLGWDGITTSYLMYSGLQGKENLIAVATAVAAILGIIGSFVYPPLRSRFGLSRTGVFALFTETVCLFLCVISNWLPGNHFDPVGYFAGKYDDPANSTLTGGSLEIANMPNIATVLPGSGVSVTNAGAVTTEPIVRPESRQMISMWVFLVGVCLSRFGLWIGDLSINQIFQEEVGEYQRGTVNGTQNSFNQLMDMLKNLFVILLPGMETFGILILLSYGFVTSGFISMCLYCWKYGKNEEEAKNIKNHDHFSH